jgi:hypothetical protein
MLLDPLDPHLDWVAEPERAAAAPSDKCRSQVVELEVIPGQPACGQEALEHVAEADEHAGPDHADDLALPGFLPTTLEQLGVEQPRETQLVG